MPRAITGSSVVITGASSGIGYCAAAEFARRGASLTLAARQPEGLEAIAVECRRHGARTKLVPTDVSDRKAIEHLARVAERTFGGIDTWVNGAGVMAYGMFEQVPAEVFEQVIATNLNGQVYGSRAALERFRAQGGGVLINLSSVWGRITTPLVAPYVVSKHAVRALSECLRHELVDEPEIHVVTVLPQAVDTPIFEHSANYSGRGLRPVPPLHRPESVAAGIVACAESPKREITYGRAGRMLELLYAIAPSLYCRVAPATFMRGTFATERVPKSTGNVFLPAGGRPSGAWRASRLRELSRALFAAAQGFVLGLVGKGDQAARAVCGSDADGARPESPQGPPPPRDVQAGYSPGSRRPI
jgi:short-subunit dehydrogenase